MAEYLKVDMAISVTRYKLIWYRYPISKKGKIDTAIGYPKLRIDIAIRYRKMKSDISVGYLKTKSDISVGYLKMKSDISVGCLEKGKICEIEKLN